MMITFFKRFNRRHKNNKLRYYLVAVSRLFLPGAFLRATLPGKLARIRNYDQAYILKRVNYYNKLTAITQLSPKALSLADLRIPKKFKVYFFDVQEYTRYFNERLKINFLPGDIVHVPDEPTLLKSRPVSGQNENSVLLKLNKIRHFIYTKDTIPFHAKKNMLVGRSVVEFPKRIRFMELYFNHPMCDVGQINRRKNKHWVKERLTLDEHLAYKFILCLEGHDVASNLKWVMSSNSLAVMPEPEYESWFMEGSLIPGYHYVRINRDYSDLEAQLSYYIQHPDKALEIIRHANAYVGQFRDKNREDLISLLVLEKYFLKTGQFGFGSH